MIVVSVAVWDRVAVAVVGLIDGEAGASVTGTGETGAVMLVAVSVAVLAGLAFITTSRLTITVGGGVVAVESSKMKPAAAIQAHKPTASAPITL